MNQETINAIASRAIEDVFIVKTDKEVYEIKRAMRNVAARAIRDTKWLDRQAVEYVQNKYLSTLDEGAEKEAVKKAFETVLADFVKDEE